MRFPVTCRPWRATQAKPDAASLLPASGFKGQDNNFALAVTGPHQRAPRAAAARPSAKLQGEIAKADRHAGHSREASTPLHTAFLRIMSRIDANAFEHFRRAADAKARVIARSARGNDPGDDPVRWSSSRGGLAWFLFRGEGSRWSIARALRPGPALLRQRSHLMTERQ
jgi:hypothetical protein